MSEEFSGMDFLKSLTDEQFNYVFERERKRDARIAELTAERDMLAKALEIALVDQRRLSGLHSYRGDDDSESRCDERIRRTEEVLSKTLKQAPAAQEVREGLG